MTMLAFKGVDYCRGLSKFGYTETVMYKLLPMVDKVEPWFESMFRRSRPLERVIRFYPERFMTFLRYVDHYHGGEKLTTDRAVTIGCRGKLTTGRCRYGSPRKPRGGMPSINVFNSEILDMVWTVLYAAQFDSERTPGGPAPLTGVDDEPDLFEEARTVEEAIADSTLEFGTIDFTETHPTTEIAFAFGYGPEQEAIVSDMMMVAAASSSS